MDYQKLVPTLYGTSGQPLDSLCGDVDFEALQEMLTANRTAGYVFSRHRREAQADSSAEVQAFLQALKKPFRQNQYRNTLLLDEAREVFAVLNHYAVDWVALKGASLIPQVYRDLGSRKMGDIDLLVAAESVAQTLELLHGLGYVSQPGAGPQVSPIELTKTVAGHHINIDLTFRPLHRSLSVRHEVLAESLLRGKHILEDEQFGTLAVPSVEDQIAYISGNIALHNDNAYMTGLLDLYELAVNDPPDWQQVLERAGRVNLDKAVLVNLYILHQLFALELPTFLLQAAQPLVAGLKRTPAMVFLEYARIVEDYSNTSVLQRDGGLKKNLARLYWRSVIDTAGNRRAFFHYYVTAKLADNNALKRFIRPLVVVTLDCLLSAMKTFIKYWLVAGMQKKNFIA